MGWPTLSPYFDRLPYPKFAGLGKHLQGIQAALPKAAVARAWIASISDERMLSFAQLAEWRPLRDALLKDGPTPQIKSPLRKFWNGLESHFVLGPRVEVDERLAETFYSSPTP